MPVLEWYSTPLVFGLSISQLWFFLGPLIGGVVSAAFIHWLAQRRDQKAHLLRLNEESEVSARKIMRDRLLEAYRALDASEPQRVHFLREKNVIDQNAEIELARKRAAALCEINLFGDEFLSSQIEKMLNEGLAYDTSKLMNHLRDLLRERHGMNKTEARYKWLDVAPNLANRSEIEEAKIETPGAKSP